LSNSFCTNRQLYAGAKFNKCTRSSACGSTSTFFIIKDQLKDVTVDIKALGICEYKIYYVLEDPNANYNSQD
jgi:hypothetical protein